MKSFFVNKRNTISFISMIMFVSVFALLLTGCKGKNTEETDNQPQNVNTETATPTPEQNEEHIQGTHTAFDDMKIIVHTTEELKAEALRSLQDTNSAGEKYGFSIEVRTGKTADKLREELIESTLSGKPEAQVYFMSIYDLGEALSSRLLADVSLNGIFGDYEGDWSGFKTVGTQFMTRGQAIYGLSSEATVDGMGIFWNKRLFEEKGIERDLPYNYQKENTWNRRNFFNICVKWIGGLGEVNSPCVVISSYEDFVRCALAAEGFCFISKDTDGRYYNSMGDLNFEKAVNFCAALTGAYYHRDMYSYVSKCDPDKNAYVEAFKEGRSAMLIAPVSTVLELTDMQDEFGFVTFPGEETNGRYVYHEGNVFVFPASLEQDTLDKTIQALVLCGFGNTKTYEYDLSVPDNAVSNAFCDERAVSETLELMRNSEQLYEYLPFVYDIDFEDFIYDVFSLGVSPGKRIGDLSKCWEAYIDDANRFLR